MALEMIETKELVVGLPHQQALFRKYQSQPVLEANRIYKMNLKFKHQPLVELKFTTTLDPCLATVKEIKRDLGKFIEEVADEVLLKIIFENSQLVEDLAGDGADLSGDSLLKVKKKWVRFKTDCDLVETIYLGMAKDFGTFKKVIGDITISNTQNLPGLETLLKRFKDKVQEAEDELAGSSGNFVSSFVKASNTYTYSERGTF